MKKTIKVILISLFILIIVLCSAFYLYTLDKNIANSDVYEIAGYAQAKTEGNLMIFSPPSDLEAIDGKALIFYPGGKVESNAYAPLMLKLAREGVLCILVDMPMNLAIFDVNAADDIYAQFPDIDHWYLMGHSLGGAMASSYVEENYAELDGLILLGAYPLNNADVDTLIIYGSEDVGLDREKLIDAPNQYELEGGNHSYFGNYNENERNPKRDGDTSLSHDEQQEATVDLVISLITNKLQLD